MKFTPNSNWVVLPDPTSTETESGIILDKTTIRSRAKSNVLKVLAVGPQCFFVKVGDTAVIDPRSEAIQMPIDGQDCLLISEHQIVGKE
tara:strand:+ start:1174 stop:1440 length:267 start_codon:yes stop_codon:yes gene_type:complete